MGTAVLAFGGMAWAAPTSIPATSVLCTPSDGIAEHENSPGTGIASITYDGSMDCSGEVSSISLAVSLPSSANDSTWSTLVTKSAAAVHGDSLSIGPYTYNNPTPGDYYRTHTVTKVTHLNGTKQTSTVNSSVDYAPFVTKAPS